MLEEGGEDLADWRAASWAATDWEDSRDIPSVSSGCVSGASMSTSPVSVPPDTRPEILNIALSFPVPMPPRNLNCALGAVGECGICRYTAAALSGGRVMPGRMKTAMWLYERAGRVKRKDVGVGAEVGVVIGGRPVGRMPKSWGRGWVSIVW